MVDLIATSPLVGMVPVTIGSVTLAQVEPGHMTLAAPFKGQEQAVSKAMQTALGFGFPRPNQNLISAMSRALWVGGGQALVMGDLPDLTGMAALSDQSDAFACVSITGAGAGDVLARLVPIDLRAAQFQQGQTARTMVGHMTASVTPIDTGFEVMVMRSMAGTLVHDLERAALGVAGRG